MMIDKKFCMSSFLQFRTIFENNKSFTELYFPKVFSENKKESVFSNIQLEERLKYYTELGCEGKKAAIALSGGIDSAILAKFMPKGSIAYTFKCVVPGIDVIDETIKAEQYCRECGLEHRIVEIYWEDFEKYLYYLMKKKGFPVHSIEILIYKAAMQAKADGNEVFVFGESADNNFGGLDGLLSKDWKTNEFIERFSYLMPHKVMKNPIIITNVFEQYTNEEGFIDTHEFLRHISYRESMGSYLNAVSASGLDFVAPYSNLCMGVPLDLNRIRNGEGKYWIREIFSRLYPGFEIPKKTPMPRPVDEWFKNWNGPKREEFWPNCVDNLSGDQKYYVWVLEKFLNMIDGK